MKKIAALLYIFIVIFTSCEEEVEYEDLGVKNIIVVNGRFIDGETPWCQVSRSDIIFEQTKNKITPTKFLPNAVVSATEGSSDFKYVVVGDSAMMEADGLIAKAGKTYTLKAQANNLEDVYSTVTVPSHPKATFELVSVEKEKYNSIPYYYITDEDFFNKEFYRYKATYELNIEDDPNTEDYYQVLFSANYLNYKYEKRAVDTIYGYWDGHKWEKLDKPYIEYQEFLIDSFMAYKQTYDLLESNDPVMNWNKTQSNGLFDEEEWNEWNIFNDQLFNGQSFKVRFNLYIDPNDRWNANLNDPVYFEFRHINKEMYMYYRTYQKVQDNDWTGSLSPYMLYCNVEHGAGLIAAWSAIKGTLKKPDIPDNEK